MNNNKINKPRNIFTKIAIDSEVTIAKIQYIGIESLANHLKFSFVNVDVLTSSKLSLIVPASSFFYSSASSSESMVTSCP